VRDFQCPVQTINGLLDRAAFSGQSRRRDGGSRQQLRWNANKKAGARPAFCWEQSCWLRTSVSCDHRTTKAVIDANGDEVGVSAGAEGVRQRDAGRRGKGQVSRGLENVVVFDGRLRFAAAPLKRLMFSPTASAILDQWPHFSRFKTEMTSPKCNTRARRIRMEVNDF
jgi:hypothetical protein